MRLQSGPATFLIYQKSERLPKPHKPANALDSQPPNLIVVILAIENVPLLRTFDDNLALRTDLQTCCLINLGLLGKERFESLASFLPDCVSILKEIDFVYFSQGVGYRVGQFVQLVAGDSHSTALYLRVSSPLTFLNISAYCAPDLSISC